MFVLFFFISVFSSSIFLCNALSYGEIRDLAKQTFDEQLPGFSHTLCSSNWGKWFELELGLHLKRCLYEDVVGFSFEIRVLDSFVSVPLQDYLNEFELRTTEYDVITKRDDNYFFYEAKAGKEHKREQWIKQFIKERNMLKFFRSVYEEMRSKNRTISFSMRMKKKKLPELIINGNVTGGENIRFACTWVRGKTEKICLKQWLNVIKMLASGSLILAFKKKLSIAIKEELKKNNFFYYMDEVKYDFKQDLYLQIAFLEKSVNTLSIV
jgi:hypothetical protein